VYDWVIAERAVTRPKTVIASVYACVTAAYASTLAWTTRFRENAAEAEL
jgi:hypothetical protein